MQVYVVQHEYEREGLAEVKLIGVYGSREDAEQAVQRISELSGFRDCRNDFSIGPYELGVDHWTTGFVTVITERTDQAA